jgi:hypothetical protein
MQGWLIGLAIGLFIGANVGIVAAALCRSAKDRDEPRGQQRQDAGDQQPHGEVVVVHR